MVWVDDRDGRLWSLAAVFWHRYDVQAPCDDGEAARLPSLSRDGSPFVLLLYPTAARTGRRSEVSKHYLALKLRYCAIMMWSLATAHDVLTLEHSKLHQQGSKGRIAPLGSTRSHTTRHHAKCQSNRDRACTTPARPNKMHTGMRSITRCARRYADVPVAQATGRARARSMPLHMRSAKTGHCCESHVRPMRARTRLLATPDASDRSLIRRAHRGGQGRAGWGVGIHAPPCASPGGLGEAEHDDERDDGEGGGLSEAGAASKETVTGSSSTTLDFLGLKMPARVFFGLLSFFSSDGLPAQEHRK